MLKELRVRNFAIIDELALKLEPGLNVLTGETGAGKSIIIGALGIALGQRAYTEMVKTGSDGASVEAYFDITGHPLLEDMGIESSEGITIRRNISPSGKTRAYLNDTMVNVQTLAGLGRTLVDMHGQHEHQSLLSAESQLRILDHYGKLDEDRLRVETVFKEVEELKKRLEDLKTNARQRVQRLDLLRFQINEIDASSPAVGEDTELEEERAILANLSRLNELLETSYALLYSSDGSCLENLSSALSKLKEMSVIDRGISEPLQLLESALPLVEDASISLRGYKDKYEMNPERLARVEDRLDLLKTLKKKYGDTIEAVLKYRKDAEGEVESIETSDELIEAMEKTLGDKEAELDKTASSLSEKRKKASQHIAAAIKTVLKQLAMEKSDFSIDIKSIPVTSSGIDAIEFLFSANTGEPLKPLVRVASGGELSRIMLALKSVLREADDIPVLIFDEVDAGIGGKTARNVAKKLREISKGRQVICITHLPQIASAADTHLFIEKAVKNGKPYVTVKELSVKDRQTEIARMLSGKVTEASLEHAKEIITGGATAPKD